MHSGQTRPGLVLKTIQNITTILLPVKFVDGVGLGLEHGISNIDCNWGIMGWSRGWNLGPGWLSPKHLNLGFCWDSPLVWYLGLCWSRDWILGSKLGISDRCNLRRSCFLGCIGTWFVAGTFRRSAVWGINGINGWIGLGQPGFCWVSPMDWILGWHWDLQMSWNLDFNKQTVFFSLDSMPPIHPLQYGDDEDKYAQCHVVLTQLMVCGRLKQNHQQKQLV